MPRVWYGGSPGRDAIGSTTIDRANVSMHGVKTSAEKSIGMLGADPVETHRALRGAERRPAIAGNAGLDGAGRRRSRQVRRIVPIHDRAIDERRLGCSDRQHIDAVDMQREELARWRARTGNAEHADAGRGAD